MVISPDSATPLDTHELDGLIPSDIATRDHLNQAEQANIIEARAWAFSRRQREVLTEAFVRAIHHRMFYRVWKWAGRYRKTEKNLGVTWLLIPEEISKLIADTRLWIADEIYGFDELGARFHHRLVSIHPFPNGNGRHARLLTDLLLAHRGQEPFSWGQKNKDENFGNDQDTRKSYIQSLQEADQYSFSALIRFVRS